MCTLRIRRDWIAHSALAVRTTDSVYSLRLSCRSKKCRDVGATVDRPRLLALSFGTGWLGVDHNHVISIEAALGGEVAQECRDGCVPCVRMRKLRDG